VPSVAASLTWAMRSVTTGTRSVGPRPARTVRKPCGPCWLTTY